MSKIVYSHAQLSKKKNSSNIVKTFHENIVIHTGEQHTE